MTFAIKEQTIDPEWREPGGVEDKPELALPKSVKVGPFDYTIEVWTPSHASAARRSGETDRVNKIIRIDCSLGRQTVAETMLHEILHAVWFTWGIYDKDEEERTVTSTASGLASVWRDSPGVMNYIAEMLKG